MKISFMIRLNSGIFWNFGPNEKSEYLKNHLKNHDTKLEAISWKFDIENSVFQFLRRRLDRWT